MRSNAVFSSKSDEWSTPESIFFELDKEFNFNLDPCATELNHKTEKYFTIQEDGLKQSWGVQCVLQSTI